MEFINTATFQPIIINQSSQNALVGHILHVGITYITRTGLIDQICIIRYMASENLELVDATIGSKGN